VHQFELSLLIVHSERRSGFEGYYIPAMGFFLSLWIGAKVGILTARSQCRLGRF
jgi:hypothetical protein